MKPKTKAQKQIARLSRKLSPLTEKQAAWAHKNALEHIGFATNKSVNCMECGQKFPHKMKAEKETIICPYCHTELEVQKSRKRKDTQIGNFTIITTKQGFQVFRHFYIEKMSKVGEESYYYIEEVVQRWLSPDGDFKTLARLKKPFSYYHRDVWCHGSPLEIRQKDNRDYYFWDEAIYPIRRYIPTIKRNGFKGIFYDVCSFKLFRLLLINSTAETLIKTNQFDTLAYMVYGKIEDVEKLWKPIKICIRNNYIIRDFSIWKDYIELLEYFHKDIHNAAYVCPPKLKAEHDRLVIAKETIIQQKIAQQEEERKRQKEEKKKRISEARKNYRKQKACYLPICFSDGVIQVKPLQNIREFIREGKILKHCVYENSYFAKPDSLIMSARIGKKSIETIEVSLDTFTIIQCRGMENDDSPYHDRILKLVKKNMNLIRRAWKQEKKQQMQSA